MKSYIQGLITGSVLVFSFIVLIGSSENNQVGSYQVSTTSADNKFGEIIIFETVFDTKSGKINKRKKVNSKVYIWES